MTGSLATAMMIPSAMSHVVARRAQTGLTVAAALTAAVSLAGCATGDADRSSVNATADRNVADRNAETNANADADELYLIGPRQADRMGYRIEWQAVREPGVERGFKEIFAAGDAAFTLDHDNFLTRVQWDNGRVLWTNYVEDSLADVHGVTYLANRDEVYVTLDSSMVVMAGSDGSHIERHRLGEIASTGPVVSGPYMIYGARNGRLAWHAYGVGHMWRAYQTAPSIRIKPLLYRNHVIVVGQDGSVSAVHASRVARMWRYKALARITARPAVGNDAVYVASRDQYLRAFDVNNGRRLWQYLTESRLETSPTVIGNRVYQYVPTEGLVCLAARPQDRPGGQVHWRSPDVRGEVITTHRGMLIAWDDDDHRLTVLDARSGNIEATLDMPDVQHIWASDTESGQLLAVDRRGRLIRLAPRG